MKKGIKITTASFLALSALTPVAVFAAEENENTVASGVYTSTGFYTLEDFQKLSTTDKVAALNDESSVIVVGEEAVKGSLILSETDAQIEEAIKTPAQYAEENGVEFTENGVKPTDGEIGKVDTAALEAAIASAEELVAEEYTAETWAALEEALAFEVTEETTQEEVDAAVAAINAAVAALELAEEVVELAVESVSAINLKQFVVTFNKAVDKTSAEDKVNYNFDKVALAAGDVVKLNADGKSVTVTLATSVANQLTKEVSVKDVKDTSGAKISAYKADVSFLDLTIPTVVSAKQIAPNEVQVFFSEPVQGAGFLLDGGKYSAVLKSTDDATNSVILTTGTLEDGEHTLTINSNSGDTVRDYANLKVAKTDVKFTAAKDTTAPTLVSAEAKSQMKVVLTFSETVDLTTLGTNVYHTSETAAYKATSVTPVAGTNNTQFEVVFPNAIPTGTATFLVSKEAAKDNFGNKNAAVLQTTASVVADTVKPTVTSFKYVDTAKAEITLSEEVTGADVKGNFKVTDKDGKAVDFTVTGYTDKDKKVTLNFNPRLKEGSTYSVEVTGLKDKAVVPNELDKYTTTFTATDVTGPIISGTGVYNQTDRTITVFFNESIDGTTALDKTKYTLQYSGKELALPADATVTLGGNNTSVTIKLPTTVKDANGTDISASINGVVVGQLQDTVGNKSKTFTPVNFTAVANLIAADVQKAKTVDTRTVQFEVKAPLKTIAAADFTVGGNAVEFATFENKTLSDGSYGALVTLKVSEANKWATNATPAIATITPLAPATISSESLYGGKFAATTTFATATDGVAPAVAKAIDAGKEVDNVTVSDLNGNSIVDTITITFTENLKPSTVSVDDFKVAGYEVTDINPAVTANTVTLKIKEVASVNITDTFVVTLVGNISDSADNILAADAAKEYKTLPVSPSVETIAQRTAEIKAVIPGAVVTASSTSNYVVDVPTSVETLNIDTFVQTALSKTVVDNVVSPISITKGTATGIADNTSIPVAVVQGLINADGTFNTDNLGNLKSTYGITTSVLSGLKGATITINGIDYTIQ